ncbi:hypothetical protein T4A_10620 [Trichinella pseudospiralis]|uniref:Uncharacterized protein n=1 Tax=Trichinella pseudospiralis TaxID=6337 RepID=A0A0V1ESP5_TRIPS|nr:hypothetical protein T4A_10620 [Trichinella pseudospiralis]
MFLKRRIRTVFDLMFPRGIENLEDQKRKMENTSGNRADCQFKIGETVMVRDYTRDRKLWWEGVIVGKQGQVTWRKSIMSWVGSLLDEALPAGNSPERNAAADENVQGTETQNIFQDQQLKHAT